VSHAHAHHTVSVDELPKRLGLFDATMIVAGSMIGSGIFIVSAEAARHVPSAAGLILVWLLTMVITVGGAWSYGRLAVSFPRAGGQYVYLREAFGDMGGFLYGWAMLLVIQTGTLAAVGVAFAKYLGVLVPAVHSEPWVQVGFLRLSPVELVGIALIAFLTWWNTTSVRRGAVLQNVFTVAKIASLFGLLVLCLFAGRRITSPEFQWGFEAASLPLAEPLLWAFAVAAVQPLFAADSWNNVTFLSEEVRDPGRNVPRALLAGTGLVCTLYLLTNVGYVNVLPAAQIANAPQDRVATAAIGALFPSGPAAGLMAAVILVSTFGCLNGLILAGARVLYAMSRDGLFLAPLGRVDEQTKIPVPALVAQGVWAALLTLSGKYGDLLDFVMIAVLAFYVATIVGRFKLARSVPSLAPRGLADRLVPAVYVALVLYVCIGEIYVKPAYPVWSLVIVLTGIPAFFAFRHRNGARRAA
jgi:APA family basic amino acid/polyamine antiporter